MEWITSLFSASCPFCRKTLGNCLRACEECARQAASLECAAPLALHIGDYATCTAFEYAGWMRSLILAQKKAQTKPVLAWLASQLASRMPPIWRSTPIAWVPGKPTGPAHLVESLALGLRSHGLMLAERAYLKRALLAGAPQKALTASERLGRWLQRNSQFQTQARGIKRKQQELILFDDVITTGATASGCAQLLERDLGIKVVGIFALAYTPRRSGAKTPRRHVHLR